MHRLQRLAHENGVMPGAGPGGVDIVALPKGRRRQNDVAMPDGRGHEIILSDDEFHRTLRRAVKRLAPLFSPQKERETWERVLDDLLYP